MKTFTIGEALEFGWRKMREHNGLLLMVMLSLFVLQVVQAIVDQVLNHTLIGSLADLVLAVVSIVMVAGVTLISLKLAVGESAQYAELFPWNRMVWHFFLVSLLSGGIMLPGATVGALGVYALKMGNPALLGGLLIVVGIVAALYPGVRLSMARFAVVDSLGPIESLKVSWRATRGHWWHLLGFLLVLMLINILGALLLLVGLLVSVPVSMLAWAHVYRKLKQV